MVVDALGGIETFILGDSGEKLGGKHFIMGMKGDICVPSRSLVFISSLF